MTGFARKMAAGSAMAAALIALSACTPIREGRGYIVDPVLVGSIQPGIDDRRSVEGTLGRPTFASQFGDPTWYYISSTTSSRPLGSPRISAHSVLAVKFDEAGNVVSADRTGLDQVVYLSPDGDATPTLGRERGFLEDLFGNIGQVGGAGAPQPGGPGQP